jgi:hypothetical protein
VTSCLVWVLSSLKARAVDQSHPTQVTNATLPTTGLVYAAAGQHIQVEQIGHEDAELEARLSEQSEQSSSEQECHALQDIASSEAIPPSDAELYSLQLRVSLSLSLSLSRARPPAFSLVF